LTAGSAGSFAEAPSLLVRAVEFAVTLPIADREEAIETEIANSLRYVKCIAIT